VVGEAEKIIGKNIKLAAYGLSGTKKLKKGVSAALKLSPSKAVIMSHHGALCYGKDYDEAFSVAAMLEKVSAEYILAAAKDKFGIAAESLDEFASKIVNKVSKSNKSVAIDKSQLYNSSCDRENGRITLVNVESGEEMIMDLGSGNVNGIVSDTAEAHRSIYLAQPKLNYIIHNADKPTVAVSVIGKKMKPLIDDFGQICGTSVKVAKTPDKCGKKIRGKNAVLLKDRGALCCGGVQGDAEAVDMIMTKSSLALLTTKVLDAAKPVNPVAALLERIVYTKKYSKQATK
jgi:L-fuculose-phosphate aldolase